MAKYQYEALLRDIHEFTAMWTYIFAAILILIGSEFFLIVPAVAYGGAAWFLWRAFRRFREGYFVYKYQQNLRTLAPYTMRPKDLIANDKQLFIGVGFQWKIIHVQRIYDLNQTKNDKYREKTKFYNWARDIEYNHATSLAWRPLLWYVGLDSRINPARQLRINGQIVRSEGSPYIHAVGMPEGEINIVQPLDTRVGHTLVVGTTRVGKTVLCRILVTQDIRRGDVVIVFDPKGDVELLIAMWVEAIKAGRGDQFYMFHLGFPEASACYNPIGSFSRVTEVASRVANQMPDGGQSSAFKQFVWGYVNHIAKTLVALGETPNYPKIKQYSADIEPLAQRYYKTILLKYLGDESEIETQIAVYTAHLKKKAEDRQKDKSIKIEPPTLLKERSIESKAMYCVVYSNYDTGNNTFNGKMLTEVEIDTLGSITKALFTDPKYMDKLVASLQPFLEKMTTGAVSKLISPDFIDKNKPVFDWSGIIQQGGIVYIGLDALSDSEVAAAVGNSMFADLTSVAGRLYKYGADHGLPDALKSAKKTKISLHADEFNELAGAEFVPMLNKAGGAGIQVTAYTQTIDDIEARVGSSAKAQQMIGNFNTTIMMRVLNEATAELITSKFDKVSVSSYSTFSSSAQSSVLNDGVDFTSASQTRENKQQVDLVRPEELIQLPKGQGFAMLDGNKLYKFRVPFVSWSDTSIPLDIKALVPQMRERYATNGGKLSRYVESFDLRETLNAGEGKDAYKEFMNNMLELRDGSLDDDAYHGANK